MHAILSRGTEKKVHEMTKGTTTRSLTKLKNIIMYSCLKIFSSPNYPSQDKCNYSRFHGSQGRWLWNRRIPSSFSSLDLEEMRIVEISTRLPKLLIITIFSVASSWTIILKILEGIY